MYRILICEDDQAASAALRDIVGQVLAQEQFSVDAVSSCSQFADYISRNTVDIILMDIAMPDGDGVELLRQVGEACRMAPVIFITAYQTYCQDMYRVPHVWFLLKPVTAERLSEALDKAVAVLREERSRVLSINIGGMVVVVNRGDIAYMESRGRRVSIVMSDGKEYSPYISTRKLLELLDDSFVQCHRSFIVNMAFIDSIEGNRLNLQGGADIPIGQKYVQETKRRFLQYIKKTL